MYDPIERENEIMKILEKLSESGLDFVVVGGYAVSAYRHRFSVDADIVIKEEDSTAFEKVLLETGFRKTISKELENIYSTRFARFEKKTPKVSVDLLIGGIGVRQTKGAFSFGFLFDNSEKRIVEGTEKAVNVRIPKREILIVMKLHAGRLTDMRDIAALAFDLDMKIIKANIFRGNKKELEKNMQKLESLIENQEFQDSFKGVFMEKKYIIDLDEIRKLVRLKEA